MMRPLRSRLVACVLMVLTFVGTSGAWHAGGDDPDCAPLAAHDHSAHHARFGAATTTQAPGHCAICHWLQSFRTGSPPETRVAFDDSAASPILVRAQRSLRIGVCVHLPSRAPPV
jgi:hypothetical protein